MLIHGQQLVGRQDLIALPTPEATATHKPVAHSEIVTLLIESLALRGLTVVRDEYALAEDAMRMFGVLEVNVEHSGVRFAIGVRNSHDKMFSLGLTVGYRVFVCSNLAFHGDFTPITRKHTVNFDPMEVIDLGVTKMQRHFDPMKRQIDVWREFTLPDADAKAVIFDAFIGKHLRVPRKLAAAVAGNYFEPEHEEFRARTMWALQNSFTEALKVLPPVRRMEALAALARFFKRYQ